MKQKFEKDCVERKMAFRGAMLLTVTMGIMGGISEANAQSCIKTPTCAELGYAQSSGDCMGKTILKCPLDASKVYCPSDMESSKVYKLGDTFIDNNGIALGRVITLTDGGQHGRIISTAAYFIIDYAEIPKGCTDKTTGGREWQMATLQDITKNTINNGLSFISGGCYWTSNGCCFLSGNSCYDSYACDHRRPDDFKGGWSVYCVTNF